MDSSASSAASSASVPHRLRQHAQRREEGQQQQQHRQHRQEDPTARKRQPTMEVRANGFKALEPVQRYFAHDDVREWLLTPCSMNLDGRMCPGAMDCSFRMETAYSVVPEQSVVLGQPLAAPFKRVQSLFIPARCSHSRFIMGTVFGNDSPHLLMSVAEGVLEPELVPEIQHSFCRRFCVDLACPDGLEFIEVAWLRSGEVLLFVFHVKQGGIMTASGFVFGDSAKGFLSSNLRRICNIRDLRKGCASCTEQRRLCSCEHDSNGHGSGSLSRVNSGKSASSVGSGFTEQIVAPVTSWYNWTRQFHAVRQGNMLIQNQAFNMFSGHFNAPSYVIVETFPFDEHADAKLDLLKRQYVMSVLERANMRATWADVGRIMDDVACRPEANKVCRLEFDVNALAELSLNDRNSQSASGSGTAAKRSRGATAASPGVGDEQEVAQSQSSTEGNESASTFVERDIVVEHHVPHRKYHASRQRLKMEPILDEPLTGESDTYGLAESDPMLGLHTSGEFDSWLAELSSGVDGELGTDAILPPVELGKEHGADLLRLIAPGLDSGSAFQPSHEQISGDDTPSGAVCDQDFAAMMRDAGAESLAMLLECESCTPFRLCGVHNLTSASNVQVPVSSDPRSSAAAGMRSSGNGSVPPKDSSKTHECSYCGTMFSTSSNRRKHIRIVHLGEKKFNCDSCAMQFAQKSDLARHVRSQHSEQAGNASTSTPRSEANASRAPLVTAGHP
ncbi:putative transcription factor Ken [Porphyridium purpureum]|uniref:Putative transcription factor Ken n=1 Tax=Porphyridium purpureum TaxID=35688 RepID=A0A5J4YPE1_PORPP|nr:putative transcription factor Ken [Porphyridium purpureum]|eukprot:POR9030..scf296_7